MLRVKAYLVVHRNVTRDHLDTLALADRLRWPTGVAALLQRAYRRPGALLDTPDVGTCSWDQYGSCHPLEGVSDAAVSE
jgi:hypothetical protein